MARTVNNTDLVPKEVFTELSNLDKQLEVTKGNLEDVLVPVVNLTTEFSKVEIKAKDFADALKALQVYGGKVTPIYNEHDRLLKEIARLNDKLAESTSREAKEVAKLREELRQSNQELRVEAKEITAASNSINAMRANVAKLKQEWANADIGTEDFEKLSKQLDEANAKLTELERNVGIHGRNVGNYESAFGNLRYSVQQVARELPSLSIGLSQFSLAISNNVPILMDQIGRLRSEGTKGIDITKQLIKSVFSWQTALVVAVTLLTVYEKEIQNFFRNMVGSKESLDDLTNSVKENTSGVGESIAKIKDLQDKWNALSNDLKAKEKFIKDNKDAFHELGVEVTTVAEVENALTKNTDKFIESLKLKAQATAAMKLASEEYEKAIKAQLRMEQLSASTGVMDRYRLLFSGGERGLQNDIDRAKQAGNDLFDIYKDFSKQSKDLLKEAGLTEYTGKTSSNKSTIDKIAEFRKQLAEREARAVVDAKEFELKRGAELNKEIYKNELESYEKRLDAVNSYIEAMKSSILAKGEGQKNDLIRGAAIGLGLDPNSESDRAKAAESVANQLILVDKKMYIELEKLARTHSEAIRDIQEDEIKRRVQLSVDSLNGQMEELNKEEMNALSSLSVLSVTYEEQKKNIQEEYAQKRIDIQIKELEERLKIEGLGEKEIIAIKKKLGDLDLDKLQSINEKKLEYEKQYYETQKQLAEEAFAFINQLMMQNYQNKLNAIEKELEISERARDEEIERIERFEEAGAISKEQADARKAAVDERQKIREKELEEQKKEILRKQAIYEKAQALAGIAINTGMAIMKTSAQWGYPAALPFIAAISALSAVQTASVLATPIPEYAEGTQDHPGGLAIVGDGGKSEMVIANGRIFKTPSTDTLVELPKHAMVIPDFAAGLEQAKISMNKTDRVISFEELSGLVREGNSKTDKLIQIIMRHNKNEVYARELSNIRRIKR